MRMYHWGRGLELRLAREDLGMSMDEFADELRVGRSSLQRWENDSEPIPATLWDDVSKLTQHLDERYANAVDAIIERVEREAHPKFVVVATHHMRLRLAAAEAQEKLRDAGSQTRLVSSAGMRKIESNGYEDPIE